MTTRATGVLLLLLLIAACSQPAPVAPRAGIDPAVFDKVCHAENADSSSTVFQALGPDGDLRRLVVTPSNRIADMGNLIFDRSGAFLGTDTGSEVPSEDKTFMEKEHSRVAALMDGAKIPNGSEAIHCK